MAGDCTLRAAIMETNALAGARHDHPARRARITLTLTGVDERCDGDMACIRGADAIPMLPVMTADASVGDLDITGDLTITGAGVDQTLIEWAAPAAAGYRPATGDRIFHVQTTVATGSINSVVIQDLAVRNGEVGLIPTDGSGRGVDLDPMKIPMPMTSRSSTATDPEQLTIWQFRRMGGAIGWVLSTAVVLYEQTLHGAGGAPIGGGGGGGGAGKPTTADRSPAASPARMMPTPSPT